jgi:twinkle protein
LANFLYKTSCDKCGSSDANVIYDDGGSHCFSCRATVRGNGETRQRVEETKDWTPVQGAYIALKSRGLDKETCEAWQYQAGNYNGKECHIANYRDAKGTLVCQKIRLPGKEFPTLGDGKAKPLYGQWRYQSGKHLIITEGELDALSASQAVGLKWAVVSLPDGAQSAEKALAKAYDWLSNFERIVLMFDMDEPGQEAAQKAAAMLPAGRACIAALPHKDANETLLKDGPGAIVNAFWRAPPWKPDGIVSGEDITLEDLWATVCAGYPVFPPMLNEKALGLRKGELTLLTAGSGIGKSTWAREIAYALHQKHGCLIGNVFLEEPNVKTAQAYVALHHKVPLGKLRAAPDMLTTEQWEGGLRDVVQQRMWFYDHFGSLESDNLMSKLHYMAKVLKVDFIILDHISIVTSGIKSGSEGERKDIDILMTRLQSLIQETGVGILAIVHLKRVSGKSFNEGGQVSLSDLRGSGALEQLSDNVYALERDQQAETEDESTLSLIRILKCRETGETGEADYIRYNRETGQNELAGAYDAFDDALAKDPYASNELSST